MCVSGKLSNMEFQEESTKENFTEDSAHSSKFSIKSTKSTQSFEVSVYSFFWLIIYSKLLKFQV